MHHLRLTISARGCPTNTSQKPAKGGVLIEKKTESHYRSARLVQAFKILEFKMMLRFNESCHCLLSGSFILLN